MEQILKYSGLREITTTSLYTILGATWEQAVALSIISRIFSIIVTLPGVIFMRQIIIEIKNQQEIEKIIIFGISNFYRYRYKNISDAAQLCGAEIP